MLGIADRLPEQRLKLVPRDGWHFRHTDEAFPLAARRITLSSPWLPSVRMPSCRVPSFSATRSPHSSFPFLAEHFERLLCIWDSDFDRDLIEHEHPVVVIQEVVERSLERGLPVDR